MRAVVALLGTVSVLVACGTVRTVATGVRFLRACPADGPRVSREVGHRVPPFDLARHHARIRALGPPFVVREAGRVTDGAVTYPVFVVRRLGAAARGRALVVSGIHGDEVTGELALARIFDRLAADSTVADAWDLAIVPAANPVAIAHGSRYDAGGCDVNRDFGAFRTPEASLLRDLIRDLGPTLIVSLKESPQRGLMIIVTAGGSRAVGEGVVRDLAAAGVPLARRSFLGLPLASPGLWAEGAAITGLKRLLGLDTLGMYAAARGIGTYTVEGDWASPDLEQRVRAQVAAVEAVLRHAAGGERADAPL